MPWSNQSGGGGGGGWKSGGGGGGPWGQGPGRGPGQQPDLEEFLKKGQDRLRQAMPGGGMSRPFLILIVLAGLAAVAFFGFTVRVDPDELGIVTRFGKYDRRLKPGLNYRLPYPVEQVYLPKVNFTNTEQIGMRGSGQNPYGGQSVVREVPEEALMLTGDGNIVKVQFSVQWRIKDAADFLFNIQNPRNTVKEVAESAMRQVVGQNKLDFVLTERFKENEAAVKVLMQSTLDSYGAGVLITNVLMRKPDAPDQVIDAFNDVEAAKQDRQRLQRKAEAYRNRVVPEARGQAARITQAAIAYRSRIVQEARGEADRFKQVYEEYRKAPDVTRKRLFLETMEDVLVKTDKIIIDKSAGQGVVPYLPLGELSKKGGQ